MIGNINAKINSFEQVLCTEVLSVADCTEPFQIEASNYVHFKSVSYIVEKQYVKISLVESVLFGEAQIVKGSEVDTVIRVEKRLIQFLVNTKNISKGTATSIEDESRNSVKLSCDKAVEALRVKMETALPCDITTSSSSSGGVQLI